MNKQKIDKATKIALIAFLLGLGFSTSFLWGRKTVSIAKDINAKLVGNVIEGNLSVTQTVKTENLEEVRKEKFAKQLKLESALVFDMETGGPILSVNENRIWPYASLSKLMSLTVAIEKIDLNTKVLIDKTALEAEGEIVGFSEGEKYTLSDIAKAMMLCSSNDAAIALSETLPNQQFVTLMGSTAAKIEMTNSSFVEPSGLSSLNQGTAKDMGKLLTYIWKNYRGLLEVSKKQADTITDLTLGHQKNLSNINILSARSDFLGGKTGFTDEARQNLAAVFSIKGREIGIIILGADDRVSETEKIINFIKNDNNSSN